jgi:hypothetical protein
MTLAALAAAATTVSTEAAPAAAATVSAEAAPAATAVSAECDDLKFDNKFEVPVM